VFFKWKICAKYNSFELQTEVADGEVNVDVEHYKHLMGYADLVNIEKTQVAK
jgi:hypothetical protein